MRRLAKHFTSTALALSLLIPAAIPFAARAAVASYPQDTTLTVNGYPVVIVAGSTYESITSDDTSIKVVVPAGEVFMLRTDNPRASLLNDAGLPSCDVTKARQNELIINGP